MIALLGAESTGKTSLAHAMAARLAAQTGLSVACVGEWLREWCGREGRTPRAGEQAEVARVQHQRIEAAAATHDVVVCDTTALATAAYSQVLFADSTLDAIAVALHRRVDLTLLTALDLPWVADGLQRDGANLRAPIDAALRALLTGHGMAWSLITGMGDARVDKALDAVAPLLRQRQAPRSGAFTRLDEHRTGDGRWQCLCERCDVPECEQADKRATLHGRPQNTQVAGAKNATPSINQPPGSLGSVE